MPCWRLRAPAFREWAPAPAVTPTTPPPATTRTCLALAKGESACQIIFWVGSLIIGELERFVEKQPKPLRDQEKSCWEWPAWSCRFSSLSFKTILKPTSRGSKRAVFLAQNRWRRVNSPKTPKLLKSLWTHLVFL